jgi:hypothetical protein
MQVRSLPRKRRWMAAILLGTSFQFLGWLESCDERLLQVSRYVDPCGTFLANCTPGEFEARAAELGDYCIDPTCTVPGQCGGGQPLGTITELCP